MYVTLCMGTFFLKSIIMSFSLQYIQVKVGLLTTLYKVTDGWSMTSLTILKQNNNYTIICILQNSTILPITLTRICVEYE